MDPDCSMEDDSSGTPSSQFTSSQWVARARAGALPPDMDIVKWQGSQTTCAALDALMMEAGDPVRRSPRIAKKREWGSPLVVPDASSYASSSTSTHAMSSTHKTRTRPRSSRMRRSDVYGGTLFDSTPTQALKGDPTPFLDLLKDVSQKVDEKARLRTKRMEHERTKKISKARRPKEMQKSVTGRMRSEEVNDRSSVSKGKTVIGAQLRQSKSLELPLDTERSEAMDMDHNIQTDVILQSVVDTSYQSKVVPSDSIRETQSSSLMPPPPVPQPRPHAAPVIGSTGDLASQSFSRVRSSPLSSQQLPSAFQVPQMHPQLPAPRTLQANLPSVNPRPPSLQSRTASSRPPPPLGMRRVHSSFPNPYAPSQEPPTKRKVFKSPLAKPVSPAAIQSKTAKSSANKDSLTKKITNTGSQDFTVPPARSALPTPDATPSPAARQDPSAQAVSSLQSEPSIGSLDARNRSPTNVLGSAEKSPLQEADSSYGDSSWDMEQLEESLKQYDSFP